MKIKVFAVNPFREATYIASDESGEAIIIDCGAMDEAEYARIDDYITRNNLTVKMLVNTHGHIDHILGVNRMKRHYGVKFAIDSREQVVLNNAKRSAEMFGLDPNNDVQPTIDIDLKEDNTIKFGNTTLKVIYTPGHTPGGVCLYNEQDKTLFTGDTVFAGSIGRTDLPGGDYDALMNSIIKNVLPLGGDVSIYPGHGNHSTLAHEVMYNPFISEVLQGQTELCE